MYDRSFSVLKALLVLLAVIVKRLDQRVSVNRQAVVLNSPNDHIIQFDLNFVFDQLNR